METITTGQWTQVPPDSFKDNPLYQGLKLVQINQWKVSQNIILFGEYFLYLDVTRNYTNYEG